MKIRNNRGVTLVELMIVVAVLAIISTIAFPIYNGYVQKTRRVAATAELIEIGQLMESFYIKSTGAPTYAPTGFSAGDDASSYFPQLAGSRAEKYYSITIDSAGGSGYVIKAQLKSGFEDSKCGSTLTINQAGVRTVTNSSESACSW
ncbi:MAG: prepilin-type N-terminal cleavage/methylation domain-containing protein [Gammaproteobacteria bacterium]|nr:prepilin-type N-terminal cleavage/methylation domain-containing protein [Gammaproteobacteria bacterium]